MKMKMTIEMNKMAGRRNNCWRLIITCVAVCIFYKRSPMQMWKMTRTAAAVVWCRVGIFLAHRFRLQAYHNKSDEAPRCRQRCSPPSTGSAPPPSSAMFLRALPVQLALQLVFP